MIATGLSLSIILLLGLANCCLLPSHPPKAVTPLGTIIGSYKPSWTGRWYAAYEGVPYAEAPLGKLRFSPPKAVGKWDGELIATKKGQICTQYHILPDADGDHVTGCEDCLYLNIYVAAREQGQGLLPVILWIHGGAFQFGSGNEADETRLMDRDIIFVTFNYRLGPFGFLSTENRVVPGNMGLKDQNMALKWVNDNIKNFGGNPKDITIMGASSGGASVHYHYLSKLSAGLFQRGISISGVALSPWPQTQRASEKAEQLGALLGCPTRFMSKMVDCLQERPARQIAQAVGKFMPWLYNPFTPFGPVVEKQLLIPRPFLHRSPIEIINKGDVLDVPWITGVVSEEGLFTAAEFVANQTLLKQLNDNWDNIAPFLLDFNDTISLNDQNRVSEAIRSHYLGNKKINKEAVQPLIRMMGDRLYRVDFEKAVRLMAKVNKSPVRAYYYNYRAKHSLSDVLSGTTENFGVSHGDDIFLVLNAGQANTDRPEDILMQEILIDLYTSFAIDGEAYVGDAKWDPVNPNSRELRYLSIHNPKNITMEGNANFAEKAFWSGIPFQEDL